MCQEVGHAHCDSKLEIKIIILKVSKLHTSNQFLPKTCIKMNAGIIHLHSDKKIVKNILTQVWSRSALQAYKFDAIF